MDIWFFPQVYPMKDNAATNILLHISWYMCLRIFLRYMPRGGIAKMSITCMFNFTLACLMPKDFLFFSFFLSFFFFFLAALSLLCCARAFSSCGEWRLLFVVVHGLPLQWLLLLWSTGSRCAGFSSCSTQAQ